MLEGVATIADIGETRINVKAYDSKGKSVSDMFVIEVYPLENGNTNVKVETLLITCIMIIMANFQLQNPKINVFLFLILF